jgi:hypothetical protein
MASRVLDKMESNLELTIRNNAITIRGVNNKNHLMVLAFTIFLLANVLPSINSVGEISYCCEKTKSGAWCQNVDDRSKCATGGGLNAPAPTSCQATSYCKLGCCYDSREGTCMPNTPKKVCNDNQGVWDANADCEIPQCNLGCCVVGDQAAFVTLTNCKKLSADYGLETDFRSDITNEEECIASVASDVLGACVFEEDFQKTCQMLTQKECRDLDSTNNGATFYADTLCSSDRLGTNCGPTEKTTCVEGRDEVFFVDSCGNVANIYDANKINNKEYWGTLYARSESCGFEVDNAGSVSCGNCDYYSGSTCKPYDRGVDNARPKYGNNICRDLDCTYKGKTYQHGETWCEYNSEDRDAPGSESFRFVCYNNEVTVEKCGNYRQEICIQSETNGFKFAKCAANMWQECVSQNNSQDCENEDQRDCIWVKSGEIKADINLEKEGFDDWKEFYDRFKDKTIPDKFLQYVCVPKFTPGFDLTSDENDAQGICSMASTQCVAKFEKGLFGGKYKCISNCHCCVNDKDHEGCLSQVRGTQNNWEGDKESLCGYLGDCGDKKNFIGTLGYANRSQLIVT